MILIDTHFHIEKDSNLKQIVEDSKKEDVLYLILGGNSKEDNLLNIKASLEYDNIYLTLGYHPDCADNYTLDDLTLLEKQIIENKDKLLAIGEIGLDYHYTKENKVKQKELFIKQILLANKYNLPIVIHSRDAVKDTLDILKEYTSYGIIHCFSESKEVANEYIKLGYKLGIGGVLTFKNSNLKVVIKDISLENLVLETDSPFLSPIRGSVNEPKNIKLIAKCLSDIKNVSLEEVANITTDNVCKTFDLQIKKM